MVARDQSAESARPRYSALALAAAVVVACLASTSALAQTEVSKGYRVSEEMRARLLQAGDLTLRDTNFVEAMFAIRRVWGVNVVVGNDLKEEMVSCEFVDTPLHEILDTILTPRGYGYRPVGNSLVIIKQDALGAMKPLFETATIPVMFADPKEVKEAVSFYLSEKGQIQVVDSAKRLIVVDYPERIEQITSKVRELDEAARTVLRYQRSPVSEAERTAIDRGNAAAAGDGSLPPLPGYDHKAAFFDLKHTNAEIVARALLPLLSPAGKVSTIPLDNRLVVFDTPEKLALIADALRVLDVPRPQVRISALIYDAALEDIRRCGVNWNGTGFHGHNLTASGGAQDSAILDAVTSVAPAAGAANGALAITSLGSSLDVNMVIQALAQSKKSRLLADPNVTVYDQETANIDIVTEIPFQQLTQSAQGGQIGTTAFREAGVSLKVTPQIGDDDTITMLVNPRFSVLVGLTPGTNQPIIDRRETNTTVRIRNRETLVIGGLRQKNSINNRTGIPYLMNLHWPVGELFKTKDVTARDGELVVFITPEIIDLCYMGQEREHDTLGAAIPALDCIPPARMPDDACPVEEWKHRCGCHHCKTGGHHGPCLLHKHNAPTPNTVYESPDLPVEHLPPTEPVPPRQSTHDPSVPLPPVQVEESTSDAPPPLRMPVRRTSETPASLRLPPTTDPAAANPPVQRKEVVVAQRPAAPPASVTDAAVRVGPPSVKSRPVPDPKGSGVFGEQRPSTDHRLSSPKTPDPLTLPPLRKPNPNISVIKRLPAVPREETPAAQTARRLTPYDIFAPPPVGDTRLR